MDKLLEGKKVFDIEIEALKREMLEETRLYHSKHPIF